VSDYDLLNFHRDRLDTVLNEEFLQEVKAATTIRSVLFETLPNFTEIKIILEAVKGYSEIFERFQIEVWLSLSVKLKEQNVFLADGTRIESVVEFLKTYSENSKFVTTLGVNCIAPQYAPVVVKKLHDSITLKSRATALLVSIKTTNPDYERYT
jgi:S-methylmethionine-dependent homocysteine/selenocysteine methylase